MAICLTSGVKAQFYDCPDDIYYYVSCDKDGQVKENGSVYIFNFDGRKACYWSSSVSSVKRSLQSNVNQFIFSFLSLTFIGLFLESFD